MYAIVQMGGRQWRVEPGTKLEINRLPLEVGAQHTVEQVLFARDGEQVSVGKPFVAGASVVCEVTEHKLGPKVISFHYRRRENWRKKRGFRASLTRLVVKSISVGGRVVEAEAPKPRTVTAPKPKPAAAPKVVAKKTTAAKPAATTKAKTATKPAAAKKPARKKTDK